MKLYASVQNTILKVPPRELANKLSLFDGAEVVPYDNDMAYLEEFLFYFKGGLSIHAANNIKIDVYNSNHLFKIKQQNTAETRLITFHTDAAETIAEMKEKAIIFFDELAKIQKANNYTVCIENLNYLNGTQRLNKEIFELLESTPLSVAYDIGHCIHDYGNLFLPLDTSMVKNVHLHSVQGNNDHCLLFNENDYAYGYSMLTYLYMAGYSNNIVLEVGMSNISDDITKAVDGYCYDGEHAKMFIKRLSK